MGKGTALTKSQVESLLANDPKGKANLKKLMSGTMKVYCPAARKKVSLSPGNIKFAKYTVRNGRIAVRAFGTASGCKTKDGKTATAGTFIANLPGSGRTSRSKSSIKSVARSKSSKKSRKRGKSRKRSKSRRKTKRRRSSRR